MRTFTDKHNRLCLGVAGALLAAQLAGCSSSDSPTTTDSPSTPPTSPTGSIPPLAAPAISLDNQPTVGSLYWADGDMPNGGQGQDIANLACVFPSPIDYHVHAHVSIFLNGDPLAVPSDIGIVELSPTTECHYPVHTHDSSGLVHLHANTPTEFTLGQFFSIWGQPLERDNDNIAGLVGLPAVVYITDDGLAREHTGDLAAIQLISHREITIQVGTPIATIPQYVWAGD
jgi:hypothetical protein